MTGFMIAEVWCDECGLRVVAEDEGTLRSHRANLRDEGWFRLRNRVSGEFVDLCPSCIAKAPSTTSGAAGAADAPTTGEAPK